MNKNVLIKKGFGLIAMLEKQANYFFISYMENVFILDLYDFAIILFRIFQPISFYPVLLSSLSFVHSSNSSHGPSITQQFLPLVHIGI